MNTDINHKSSLLIIDDFLDNIKLLLSFLTDAGFKVLIARDGEQGIKTAQYAKPDLILLDIMMPGLNGFETCQQLKQAEATKNIPIIFMTALTDLNEKIKGFELGAADYITKPFQHAELLARINTHLSVIRLQQQLEKRNLEAEAFARTVAHDLKAPLAGVLGLIDVLKEKFQENNVIDADDIENIHLIEQSAKQMNEIILALLMLAGVSSNQEVIFLPLDMSGILQNVLHRVEYIRKEYQGIIEYPKEFPLTMGYAPWIEEVWVNYLINGLKYSGRPPHLIITANIQHNYVKFSVKDNGQGLSLEDQKKLFIPFARLSNGDHTGHGLGLSIVQQIISKLNGNVGIESQIGDGCLFYFTLPLFSETIH